MLTNTPAPGVPRPFSNNPNNPKDFKDPKNMQNTQKQTPVKPVVDPKKVANEKQAKYQSSQMAAKEAKEKSDKQNKIQTWGNDLRSERAELLAQENAYAQIRREIARLEGVAIAPLTVNVGAELQFKSFEQQNKNKIGQDKRKIALLEQEKSNLDQVAKSKVELLAEQTQIAQEALRNDGERKQELSQKVLEERKDAKHIVDLEEEIRLKTLELDKVKEEHKQLENQIGELKKPDTHIREKILRESSEIKRVLEQSGRQVADKKTQIEKLNQEINSLGQVLEFKKQETEKINKEMENRSRQVVEHKLTKEEAVKRAQLIANRIEALKQNLKILDGRVRDLKK